MKAFWVALVAVGIIAVLAVLSRRGRRVPPDPRAAEIAAQLRESVFTSDPVKVGITPTPGEAWGIIMDIGHPKAVISILSLADGSASIYVSTGGGHIGGQGQPAIREAAMAFVHSATASLGRLKRTSEHPLPRAGYTRFYVLTPEGLFGAEAAEKELSENRHELSPLFYAGHEVISQFRLTSGKEEDP